MTFDAKQLTAEQQAKLTAELSTRKTKFLPAQAIRRLVDPQAAGLKVLGATRRDKARKIASRAAAEKQAAALAAAPAKTAPAKTGK